jgi:hypothetical protein
MHEAAKRAGAAHIASTTRLSDGLLIAPLPGASPMSQWQCHAAGCLGDRNVSTQEAHGAGAAHRKPDVRRTRLWPTRLQRRLARL